jgi:DNA repair photolyase
VLDSAGKLECSAVFMSSATDPYQGIERRLCITRAALAALANRPPRRILLQTRSPLIERDMDVLRKLGDHLIASITVETDDEAVRRAFTPTSPPIARRLGVARRGTLSLACKSPRICLVPILEQTSSTIGSADPG